MTLPARPLLIAAALAVPALAAVLLLSASGSLSSTDRRLIDRWDETVETCFDAGRDTLDRSAACLQGKRLREEIEARGLCLDLTEREGSYRGVSRCDG
ncbi:hypothetical protein FA743_09655 [Paracoccus gahaiensis]|uniref:Uncharacterized protein n=1 Tax=Paracoccus gahaiensis TaxID=1706839 RepID=A0A4U0R9Q9_9RHOB|nr:hypothetical protein [Paracoccus gahaiensis]TJZ91737.1 hypothetical protein FA743_09655 [Paracoccus gahaiensis]